METKDKDTSADAKFLEPDLGFVQKEVAVGGTDSEEKALVSQFVKKEAVLAHFPNYLSLKKQGFLRASLEAGENVRFDPHSYSLIARAAGYPRVTCHEQQGNEPPLVSISIIPLVKVSHNRMQANLIIHPALPDRPSIKEENLHELVEEAGIVFGIDEEALLQAQKIIDGPCDDFDEILIAKGVFPGEGQDAVLQYELEIGPLAGHVLADGTIDFRDRKIMVGVSEGQHIATKIPAVEGAPGFNVFGQEIEPKSGKDIRIKVSGAAEFIAERNIVVATKDGAMSIVNKDVIKVATKSTIHGDVDYNTGNIESEGNTIIKGSIHPGFSVEVGGDLQIGGGVSSTRIQSNGNIVIKGGITGKNTTIGADGDIDIKFIERGTVKSGGLIVIRKQCYYSSIEAAGAIRCHRQSAVLGGILLAGGSLTVGTVGAENCDPAIIGAGVDPGRYLLYRQLAKEFRQQQEEIIQALQLHGRGARPKKIRRMEEAADETKMKLLKLNLIPGTELYSRRGQGNKRDDLEEEDPMYLKEVDIENIRIEVHGKIFAGTTLLLGNRSVVLEQPVEKRKFRLSKNLKRIMAVPL